MKEIDGPLRRPLLVSLLASLGMRPSPARAGEPPQLRRDIDLPALVNSLLPSVVNISILKQQPMRNGHMPEGEEKMVEPVRLVGSGFVIDSAGFIVTNRHVVEDAYKLTVTCNDGRSYPGQVVSMIYEPDLALMRIAAESALPPVPFANIEGLMVGDAVIAIGNPLGLSSSVSVGVVSALNRDLRTSMFDHYIQTDAAINHGNSGGPLFNLKGEVVGVNTALFQPAPDGGSIGLGLAIPADTVSFVVAQMLRYGRVRPGWIGADLQAVTQDIARAAGRTGLGCTIVTHIQPGSPATDILHPGDIVLTMNGSAVPDFRALARNIARTEPGTTVALTVWRDRQSVDLQVKVVDWPPGPDNPTEISKMAERGKRVSSPSMGMTLDDAPPALISKLDLPPDRPGVVVIDVAANSPGADAGFMKGDVITRVQSTPIAHLADLRAAARRAMEMRHQSVLVLVKNQAGFRWLAVPTDVT